MVTLELLLMLLSTDGGELQSPNEAAFFSSSAFSSAFSFRRILSWRAWSMALLLASTGKKQSVGLPREQQAEQGLILSHCRREQMSPSCWATDIAMGGGGNKWRGSNIYFNLAKAALVTGHPRPQRLLAVGQTAIICCWRR